MSFIYNLLLVLILGSSIYEFSTGTAPNRRWFNFIIFIMMMTAGLAYGLSPDWVSYWNAFEGAAVKTWSELWDWADAVDMEQGYMILNKLTSTVGLGYASFTLMIAIIALYLKSRTIFRYGGLVFMCLLMYYVPTYFFEEHVHVRQGMANAIMFFSIPYIIERKFWKFFACFVIAFLFHKAVVAFLLAYWVVKIRFNNVMIITLIGGAVIANTLGLSTAIDGIMQYMPFGVAETYNDYANEFAEGGPLGDVVKVLTVLAILLFNKQVSKNDSLFPYFRNLYLFGVFIYFFFGKGIFAARLPGFYTVYIIFVVPRMVLALKESRFARNLVYVLFTVYTMMLYINFYRNWGDRSGFGNYTTSLNSWVPYGFTARNY